MQNHRFLRAQDVAGRVRQGAGDFPSRCLMLGCGKPTMRAAGKGLAPYYCKRHIEHRARHGSLFKCTYKAAELKPYRLAAASWVDAHRHEPKVAAALSSLDVFLRFSGRAVPASNLRGMKPRDRANAALARLREAGIEPARLLEIHMAVTALIQEDPGSHRVKEFRIVQTAKAAHRLASGCHRKWHMPAPNGRTVPFELHAYARSSGRVLRHLGMMIEQACEIVTLDHVTDVLALKVARFGRHPTLSAQVN